MISVGFASESAGGIIVSIAVSPGTRLLENGGVIGGMARGWVGILSAAAVLVRSKCLASAPAANHAPTSLVPIPTGHLKFPGATSVEIRNTTGGITRRGTIHPCWDGQHWEIVAIDEADIVEVLVGATAECDLEQRHRRSCSIPFTFQLPPAITRLTLSVSIPIKLTTSPSPYPPRPFWPARQLHTSPRLQPEPCRRKFRRPRPGQRGGPYGGGAVVGDGECDAV